MPTDSSSQLTMRRTGSEASPEADEMRQRDAETSDKAETKKADQEKIDFNENGKCVMQSNFSAASFLAINRGVRGAASAKCYDSEVTTGISKRLSEETNSRPPEEVEKSFESVLKVILSTF